MCRIPALACTLLRQVACKLHKKAASTVTSAKQLFSGDYSFAAARVATVAYVNFAAAEQLVDCQGCQGCEEK